VSIWSSLIIWLRSLDRLSPYPELLRNISPIQLRFTTKRSISDISSQLDHWNPLMFSFTRYSGLEHRTMISPMTTDQEMFMKPTSLSWITAKNYIKFILMSLFSNSKRNIPKRNGRLCMKKSSNSSGSCSLQSLRSILAWLILIAEESMVWTSWLKQESSSLNYSSSLFHPIARELASTTLNSTMTCSNCSSKTIRSIRTMKHFSRINNYFDTTKRASMNKEI